MDSSPVSGLKMYWLFNMDGFLPRAICGNWSNFMILAYVIPNLVIMGCYWWIPFNGLRFFKTRREGLDKQMLWLCCMFVMWCGVTHFFDVIVFKFPLYHLNIVVLNIAAYYSLRAAWHTRSWVRGALLLPSREELHAAVNAFATQEGLKKVAIMEKDELIKDQRASILRLRGMLETQIWIHDREKALAELSSMLERINA